MASNVIKLFAPFDGTVTTTVDVTAENGSFMWLNPTQSPSWAHQLIHVTPSLKVGDSFKAGQVVGYRNFAGTDLNMYDVGLERFVGYGGKLMTLEQAHQQLGAYGQMLHYGQRDAVPCSPLDSFGSFAYDPSNYFPLH